MTESLKDIALRVWNEPYEGVRTIDEFATRLVEELGKQEPVFVVFDGPPDHTAPSFVEVESTDGKSVSVDGWHQRGDYWNLGPFYAAPVIPAGIVQDAERYRWMRNNSAFQNRNGPGLYWYLPRCLQGDKGEQLDTAIDKAIAAAKGDKNG